MYLWSSSQSSVFAQEGDNIEMPPPCRTLKTELIASSLNLPAQVAGMVLAALLAVTLHREGDLWTSAASAPMVVLLWYWVGFWIDRRLVHVGLRKSRFHLPRILAKLAQVFSILMVIFSAILIVRALISQGHLDSYVVTGSFTCWSVFCSW
jgi:prolipoprotein diacylglyceryltransferase